MVRFLSITVTFWATVAFVYTFMRLSRGAPLTITSDQLTPIFIVYVISVVVRMSLSSRR